MWKERSIEEETRRGNNKRKQRYLKTKYLGRNNNE
jgi:hypothetical protein